MSNLREAAQQALEALEGGEDSWRLIGPAIDAIKVALEQPEQEPVILHRELVEIHPDGTETWKETPLYTHPPRREWRGLTDEAVIELLHSCDWRGMHLAVLVRAIEQALKEKNQ